MGPTYCATSRTRKPERSAPVTGRAASRTSDGTASEGEACQILAWLGITGLAGGLLGCVIAGEHESGLALAITTLICVTFVAVKKTTPAVVDVLVVISAAGLAGAYIFDWFEGVRAFGAIVTAYTVPVAPLVLGLIGFRTVQHRAHKHPTRAWRPGTDAAANDAGA